MRTETCNLEHPTLCLYLNDLNYPAKCPEGYYAFRHMFDDGSCYGIEKSNKSLTYKDFSKQCKKPMGQGDNMDSRKLIFTKVAELIHMPNYSWCWFSSFTENHKYINSNNNTDIEPFIYKETTSHMKNIINNVGTIALLDSSSTLSCMACEADIIYGETELFFEYDIIKNKIYLTIYFPSGLWKYNQNDRGVQCFSDAKGFFKVIEVFETISHVTCNNLSTNLSFSSENKFIEKSIYEINLVTDRSASYWCEGHTKNFSLITTEKIVVNPQGRQVHVFSLVMEIFICLDEINDIMQLNSIGLTENLNEILQAEKVIIMDVLDYKMNTMQVVLHVHVSINDTYKIEALNLLVTYHNLLHKIDTKFPSYNYTLINMSSSVYCLPAISQDSIPLYWDLTPIGHIAAPKQFCLQSNGLPVNRHCFGSYLLGSFWGMVKGRCDKSYEPSITTTLLFNFIQGKLENEFVTRFLTSGLQKVLGNTDIIIPADIYYLSISFQQILNIAHKNETFVETGDIQNIAWAVDRIMAVNKNNLRLAQTLNSTNVILDSINDIITMISRESFNSFTNKTIKKYNAYQLAIEPRFVVQISYPRLTNITGLAIINSENSDQFNEMQITPLYENMTLKEVLSIEHLEVATWFPNIAISNLQNNSNKDEYMHMVINVFSEDVIFQQLNKTSYVINSRIIEVEIPGYSTNSEFSIPIIFKNINHTAGIVSRMCGYWDFHSNTGNIPGKWSDRGCTLIANVKNMTICECYHLTHFGQLININIDRDLKDTIIVSGHQKALNIITLIGSSLSITGIIGIWITAIVFDLWRKKTGTKVLLQLSTAIALPLILIVFFNVDNSFIVEMHDINQNSQHLKIICIILGAIFHYSVLTNFMWMLITAILQFLRYVRVLGVSRPSKFMIKLALIGWGLPSIPVIIVLILDRENYIPRPDSERRICYPSGIYMMLGVVLPVSLILIVNIILFISVIKAISRKSDMRTNDRSLVCAQFRLSIFLFFLLGLTWVFGIMSFSGSVICSYIFCLTSTVQGFVLFIYFIICDPSTRNLWVTVMKPQFLSSRNSITTISSG
ncbi:unnamed protein product [Diatraea saccharalis]|uniref:Uncharacterized protein n=1 Tax=Diatraea saccharalis TaxID=40085 RepID=A0A9N9WKM8_9NEOP|nr:unnamed protein product [Diatraea saccharalis]